MAKELYQEVIDEIGTQTLARFGLNIFSFNTYDAYGASLDGTTRINKAVRQHQNNPNAHGQYFEAMDTALDNIKFAFTNSSNRSYTTDELGDIRKTQDILKSGKNLDNLSAKDRAKVEYVKENFPLELEKFNFNDPALAEYSKVNHTTTDKVIVDVETGKINNTAQLKVIKNTKDLLEDRYLSGNNAPDELRMPLDDYVKHKANLEKMVEDGKNSSDPKVQERATKATIALKKLEANNLTNRFLCDHPKTFAVATNAVAGASHVAQAGFSDAVVVAMSTLANGIIYEVKDAFSDNSSDVSISERIKRLINKVVEKFKETFKRGSSYGALDLVMQTVSSMFKSTLGFLKQLWTNIRAGFKAVWNALYDFVTGKMSFKECVANVIKAFISAGVFTMVMPLEKTLSTQLSLLFPFLSPIMSFVAPILAISAAAFAVVAASRTVDLIFFGFGKETAELMRRNKNFQDFYDKHIGDIIARKQELEKLIEERHQSIMEQLELSYVDLTKANASYDTDLHFNAVNSITKTITGEDIKRTTQEDIVNTLKKPNRTGRLKMY